MASTERSKDAEISRLRAENHALADELAQCQADKEFVWSLWKRLQVASPDMTQAISLVVQREKEKAEIKDKKVLEILQIKDDRISELEKVLSQQQQELNDFVARKIALDGEKDVLEKENRELRRKSKSLEELLESRESRLKTNEELNRQVIDNLDRDKQDLTKRVTEHLIEADKAKEELAKLRLANDKLDNTVKILEDDLHDRRQRFDAISKEHEEVLARFQEQERQTMKQETEVDNRERALNRLRKDLSEMRSLHSQCAGHAAQQTDLIRQLQSLQFDTQQVMKNQEEAHTMEASSLQAMYADLNSRYQIIKQALEKAERVMTSMPEKSTGLQVNLAPWDAEIQACESCIISECKISSLQTEIDLLKDRLKEKSRLIYTLDKEGGEKEQDTSAAVSKQVVRDTRSSQRSEQTCSARSRSMSPIRSPLHTSSPKHRGRKSIGMSTDKKVQNLERALALKHEECNEIQAAHDRRLDRLRTLQQNYNILKEQIKTYEDEQSGKKKRHKMRRSDPRTLQQEDSDTVWNELAYFKGQNRNLLMDRMNLQEELDLLKVQTASDATHVEELTRCLQQEKEQLQVQLVEAENHRKVRDSEKRQITELKKQIKSLENLLESLEKENETLMDERDNIIKEKRTLKSDYGNLKTDISERDAELHHYKKENHHLKKKLRHKKHSRSRRKQNSLKDHQRALNKSIEQMSVIFSDFDNDGWEEVSSESGGETGESLGCQIVHSARKRRQLREGKAKRQKQEGHTTPTQIKPTTRQMASVQSHIKRLARAYDEEPIQRSGQNNIAIQTDDEVQVVRSPRRFVDTGVGEYSVDEVSDNSVDTTSRVKRRDIATSPHMGLHKLSKVQGKIHNRSEIANVSSLKQRLASLQQQVTVLRDSKTAIQKTLNDERESKEQLQSDFTLCSQRLKISKQTIQKLTQELENCQTMKESLERQLETKIQALEGAEVMYGKLPNTSNVTTNKHTDTEWKQLESRLKISSSEVSKQAGVIKTLKSENESQAEQLKTFQDKINRVERDISQKRSLIEDLRSKAKSLQEEKKGDSETIKSLEEKLKSLTDGSDQKKSYMESLKKRLSALTKEKHQYEELYFKTNAELEKKTKQLTECQTKKTEAENIAAELETAAAQQLQGLASRSESALEAVKSKLKKAHVRIQELNQFVKILAAELLNQVLDARELVRQAKKSKTQNGLKKDQSLSKAHSLASSILNMSEADIEDFMNSTEANLEEEMATEALEEHRQDSQWNKRWQAAVSSKVPFAKDLMEILMEKVTERDHLLSKVETTPVKSAKTFQL